ncbi:MAG: N-acetyl sugar amidotransferase [Alphaproteobacteria bacterium]
MISVPYKQCPVCVMDTTDPEIHIDSEGCTYCKRYKQNIPKLPKFRKNAEEILNDLVSKIKKDGINKPYDCLIGVSGGVDSSYVAYYVKEVLKLRPLALHLDNGWNDELAVHNIEKILRKLDIDLWTEVLDWNEFSSLQMSFLKASVPDCEIPTDHAIVASLYQTAKKFNIKYILVGNNLVTESIMPNTWSRGHSDWKYISSVNGRKKLKTFPHYTFLQTWWRNHFSSIKKERILSYINFNKAEASVFLQQEFGWQPYSGKHHESIYTKFYQAYWLPQKFGYDKRKGHLSALICAGQISRDEAFQELAVAPIAKNDIKNLKAYVAEKFEISIEELDKLFNQPNRSFYDYPSHYNCWQYYWVRFLYRKFIKPLKIWLKK